MLFAVFWGLYGGYVGVYVGFRGFPKLWVPFWGPNIKDYRILGSALGFLDSVSLHSGGGAYVWCPQSSGDTAPAFCTLA